PGTGWRTRLPPRVHGVCHRLHHRRLVPGHPRGDLVDRRARNRDALAEPARAMDADDFPIPTDLGEPLFAEVARSAGEDGVNRHSTSVGSRSREFVAHHERRLTEPRCPYPMELAAAYPNGRNLYDRLAFTRLR